METYHSDGNSPHSLTLKPRDVHIWRASLRQSTAIVQRCLQTLSTDETARAARFHFAGDREAFIVARGILRSLLGRYLRAAPERLRLGYEPAGKPFVDGDFADQIFFNLSHSRDMALFAFSHEPHIGIDIESIRPIEDMQQIAVRNFSANENAQLLSLPDNAAVEGFYNCWTRKEAFVKALGTGIAHSLQDFDVTLKPGEPARLLCISGSEAEAARWTMSDLNPGDDYAAAVVIEGSDYSFSHYEWTSALSIPKWQEPK